MEGGGPLAIVTYGNGVVSSLQAVKELEEKHGHSGVTVVDSPYLSAPPAELKEILPSFERVVFVDVCKQGQNPLSGHVTTLHNEGHLGSDQPWRFVAAAPTYNPLGSTITFVQPEDVVKASLDVLAAA